MTAEYNPCLHYGYIPARTFFQVRQARDDLQRQVEDLDYQLGQYVIALRDMKDERDSYALAMDRVRDLRKNDFTGVVRGHLETILAGVPRYEASSRVIRQLHAASWDEGFNAGHYPEGEKQECDCRENPYRRQE